MQATQAGSGAIIGEDLAALLPELEAFHARFGRFFCRSEGRRWGQRYVAGLLLPIARKNVENIAEQVGAPPRKLQQLVSDSPWDDAGCVTELQRLVGEQLGAPDGVLVVDDTGFAKKGTCSAGVGRSPRGPWAAATTARSASSWGTRPGTGTPWWTGACTCWRAGSTRRRRRGGAVAGCPRGWGLRPNHSWPQSC